MTATRWTNQVSANFNTAADWNTGAVPGASDDAILDAPGSTNYTVAVTTSETVSSIQTASTATLTIGGAAAVFTAANGSGSGANAGVIQINDHGTLALGGAVDNTGSIVIHSGGDLTKLVVQSAGLTLSGHGQVNLTGNNNEIIGAATPPTLTNVDNLIQGQGIIAELKLVNEAAGVIDATGVSEALTINKGTLTNSGLIEATGAAGLALKSSKVTDAGGGILSAGTGSKIVLSHSTVVGGILETSGTGVIEATGLGNVLRGGPSLVANKGLLEVVNASSLELIGTLSNKATVSLLGSTGFSDLVVGATGATLQGGGKVVLNNSTEDRIYGVASNATLTNVDNEITGSGLIGDGKLTLSNQGSIVGDSTGVLTVDTGASAITNTGLIQSGASGDVVVKSAVTNSGTLSAAGGTLTLDGAVSGSGAATIDGGVLDAASSFNENVSFTGSTGVLELSQSQSYTGSVTGLSLAGTSSLDLLDIGFVSGSTTATYADNGHGTGGVLTVTDGTKSSKINLVGNYTSSTFVAADDGHGGTTVHDPSALAAQANRFVAAMSAFTSGRGGALHDSLTPPLQSTLLSPMIAHR